MFCIAKPSAAQINDPCPDGIQALKTTPDDLSKVQADIDRFTLCLERAQLLKRLNDLAVENRGDVYHAPALHTNVNIPAIEMPDMNISFNLPDHQEIKDDPEWMIFSIFGSGADLSAKIVNNEGFLTQVKIGDTVMDEYYIQDISKTTVTLLHGKNEQVLNWFGDTVETE